MVAKGANPKPSPNPNPHPTPNPNQVAKGVIRAMVPWAEARPYFYLRVRRRLAQDALVKALQAVDAELKHQDGVALVRGWCEADWRKA